MDVQRDLDEGIGLLGYELMMCCAAAHVLGEHGSGTDPPVTESNAEAFRFNMPIETELLHLRALIEFFFRPKGNPREDVVLTDFGSTAGWPPTFRWTSLDLAAQDTWDLLNKRLVHVTWDRTASSVEWRYRDLADDMLSVSAAWGVHLATADPHLASAWRAQVFFGRQALKGTFGDPDTPAL